MRNFLTKHISVIKLSIMFGITMVRVHPERQELFSSDKRYNTCHPLYGLYYLIYERDMLNFMG